MDEEFLRWLFPPKLTPRRRLVLHLIMFAILVAVAYNCNPPPYQ